MTKVLLPPIGFFSYARQDDELSGQKLTRLRVLIKAELQMQYGRDSITLFQDAATIAHGAAWEGEIVNALGRSTFFVPIITPNFIQSEWCCREVDLFLERERRLFALHPDLPPSSRIFPIDYRKIRDENALAPALLAALRSRQWCNFQELRDKDPNSETVSRAIYDFAESICDLLLIEVEAPPTAEELAARKAEAEAAHKREVQAKRKEAADARKRTREEAERRTADLAEAEAARRREAEEKAREEAEAGKRRKEEIQRHRREEDERLERERPVDRAAGSVAADAPEPEVGEQEKALPPEEVGDASAPPRRRVAAKALGWASLLIIGLVGLAQLGAPDPPAASNNVSAAAANNVSPIDEAPPCSRVVSDAEFRGRRPAGPSEPIVLRLVVGRGSSLRWNNEPVGLDALADYLDITMAPTTASVLVIRVEPGADPASVQAVRETIFVSMGCQADHFLR